MADNNQEEEIKKKILKDWNEEKTRLEWEAPERAFQRKNKDFWVTIIAILVLVSVILFFVKEFFLIIALISILFLYYVLSTIPPQKIIYKITNRAIYFGETSYSWDLLERFWFKKDLSSQMVHFETKLHFPRRVSLVIDGVDKEKIKSIVLKKIPLIKESPNFVDKLTKWMVDKLPLDKKEKITKKA